jgi:hypothetical protein
MKFKTHKGEVYIPANINITLIEMLGENQTAIRTATFIAVVNHPIEEVITIVKEANRQYQIDGII